MLSWPIRRHGEGPLLRAAWFMENAPGMTGFVDAAGDPAL